MDDKIFQQAKTELRQFGDSQVPMIGYCEPELLGLSERHCETRIGLTPKTQNHVSCLYFGVLAVGADITGGFLAIWLNKQSDHYVELLFKDFKADFKKRALADTHFRCSDGELIRLMMAETIKTGERVNKAIHVIATTPTVCDGVVAEFQLTLALKYKPSAC